MKYNFNQGTLVIIREDGAQCAFAQHPSELRPWHDKSEAIEYAHKTPIYFVKPESKEDLLIRRKVEAHAECSRRIEAVVDKVAQINLAASAAAGVLTTEQMETYRSGVHWISQMRKSWKLIAEETDKDIYDDKCWPPVAEGVVALGLLF